MKTPRLLRLIRLIFGLFLYALGVVMQIQAHIGYAPWDIFHVGVSKTIGLSIGQVTILVGLIIVVIDWLLKERLGIGTIANMLLVGTFVDIIMNTGLIPQMNSMLSGIALLLAGMVVICFGMYFYVGSAFGAGPRDTLMVAINRRLGIPVGAARSLMELTAAIAGWLLGGMLGIGTLIAVAGIGVAIQIVFRLLKFQPKDVVHETFADYFRKNNSR